MSQNAQVLDSFAEKNDDAAGGREITAHVDVDMRSVEGCTHGKTTFDHAMLLL
jgi:hypothetical protein